MTRHWLRDTLCAAVLSLLVPASLLAQQRTLGELRIGLNWDWSHFPNFEREVGRQGDIESFSSAATTNGIGLALELRRRSWFYGASVRYGQHEFVQTYLNGTTGPTRAEGTVDAWFLDAYGGRSLGLTDRLSVDALGGVVLAVNVADFSWYFSDGLRDGSRTHTGVKLRLGTALQLDLWKGFGLRAGADYVNIVQSDADTHTRFSLGVTRIMIARNTPPIGSIPPRPPDPVPPGDPTRPRPPDSLPPTPRPPEQPPIPRPPDPPPTPTPPDSQPEPSCCGFRGQFLTYPKLTDPRVPPAVQAAPRAAAIAASNVLLPNGAYFHQAQDLAVESVGFPFVWSRHYVSDFSTNTGGMIGHRWDFTLDKRILPMGGTEAGEGLVRELVGVQKAKLTYFNGQGRAEIYEERISGRRDGIANFGTTFSAHVTAYQSPPGAFHEIERYIVYDPREHPFKDHPDVDAEHGEAVFFVLREKNGLRYVFNCRGQLIHILSRHDFTSLGAMRGNAERDSVRVTIEYGDEISPLTQSPMPARVRTTAGTVYSIETRTIGVGQLDTNIDCVPVRGPRPIPRIAKLTGGGTEIEYVYRGGRNDALLEAVRITNGPITGTTRYTYDGQQRLLTLTPPVQAAKARGDSATVANTYDGSGRVIRQSLGNGRLTWRLAYQGTTAVEATNAVGDVFAYRLRQLGPFYVTASETIRPRDRAEGGPWTTSYEHNAATQVIRLTLPRGNVVRYDYDGANDPVTLGPIRDFNAQTTYDNDLSLGNLLAVTSESAALSDPEPMSITTRYEYEPLFNQIRKETDGNGNVTEHEYRYVDKGDFGNPVRVQGPGLTQPDGSRVPLAAIRYTYNKKGQVETIVDRRGGMTTFSYAGPAWFLKQVDYPGGGVRTYDVDDRGRVREEGGSFGTTRYQHDARGRVTLREVVVRDTMVNRTWYEYDLHNNVTRTRTQIIDNFSADALRLSSGETLTLQVAAPAELVTTTEYDLLDRPVREVDGGIARSFEYDQRGNVAVIVTPSPQDSGTVRTTFDHDARGLVRRRTPGLDGSAFMTFEYDENTNLVRRQSGPDSARSVSWAYDPFDRLRSQTDGRETTVDRELDANGNTLHEVVTGASGDPRRPGPQVLAETEYRYDELNHTIVVRRHLLDATGTVDEGRVFRNGAGDVSRIVDAAGDTRTFEYDAAGRTVAVSGADLETRTTYDGAGRATLVVEVETERSFVPATNAVSGRQVSRTTGFTYDALGRVTHQSGPTGELRYFYNSLGLVRGQYEASHGLTETRYDALGRRLEVRSGGAFERFEHLPSGQIATHETPATTRVWRYDQLGRVVQSRDTRSGAITFSDWNDSGDEVTTRDPNGTELTRTFDAAGMPTRIDIRYASDAVVVDGGRRTPTLVGPTWETYDYDGLGRPVRAATSQNVSTTFRYDGLDRVIEEVQERGGVAYRVQRTYAPDQSWREILYPEALGALRVRQSLDPAGRVRRIDADGRRVAEYEFSGAERVATRTYGNGVVTSYAYDADRRLTGLQVTGPGQGRGARPVWWTNAVTYRNERLGSVEERRQNQAGRLLSAATTNYAYDIAGRRIFTATTHRRPVPGAADAVTVNGTFTRYAAGRPAAVAEYTMDGAADRVVWARLDEFELDVARRVVGTTSSVRLDAAPARRGGAVGDVDSVSTFVRQNPAASERQQFQYDRAGNLVADGSYIYAYDHANRLTRVTERSERGFKESTFFVLDNFGRRVFMTPTRERTPVNLAQWATWARQHVAFVYDGEHVIGELEVGNPAAPVNANLLARYVVGSHPGERIRMDRRRDDEPTAPLVTHYLHESAQGAIALTSDSAGRPQWVRYAPAAGATPFRAPNDLHVVTGSRTRSPYLAATMRVDGFAGIRYDEVARDQVYDFRENRALADRVDFHTMRQQIQAFQATSMASMAAVAAVGLSVVGAPAVVGMVAQLTARQAVGYAAFGGALGVTGGWVGAAWQGHEYTFGMAGGDFAEGALFGLVGGGMFKAGASLASIAAADYATGFASGFVRAIPTEGLSNAMVQGAMSGAFGATLGLGIGGAGKLIRGERATLSSWLDARRASRTVPASSGVSEVTGLNARWQRVAGESPVGSKGRDLIIYADRAATARERALERAVLDYLRRGTRASQVIAELITKGELQVKFRETAASMSDAAGYFITGTNYVTVNVNQSIFRTGNPARQIASTIVHEGTHYLGGGELAAWWAQSKFLMRFPGNYAAIPGLRYLSRNQSLNSFYDERMTLTRQGAAALGGYLERTYSHVFIRQPIHEVVLRERGMAQLIGMTRQADIDFAHHWLATRGRPAGRRPYYMY